MALTGPLCTIARIRGKILLEKLNIVEDLVNSTKSNNIDSKKVRALFCIIYQVLNYVCILNTILLNLR